MPKVTEKRKHLNNAFYFNTEENMDQSKTAVEKIIETNKTTESNQLLNKKLKNNVTKQSDTACTNCNSRLTTVTARKIIPPSENLGRMYENDNSEVISFCANGFDVDNVKLNDEKPKYQNVLRESVDRIEKPSSILLKPKEINLKPPECRDYVLENVEKSSTQKVDTKCIDINWNMTKPLPSLMDLERLFESNGASDEVYNRKIKNSMKRSWSKIKEKDKITKSKQLLIKKQKNIEKKQNSKTSGLILGTMQKPLPTFTDLEQMFEDNINDNFKSFHINDMKNMLKSPKSLRTLANNIIKLSTSPGNCKRFTKIEPLKNSDTSKNLGLTSSKCMSHLNELEQLCYSDSENDYPFLEVESEGTNKLLNRSEMGADGISHYNGDCCQFSAHVKFSPLKDNSVLLFDEKVDKCSETTYNLNIDSRSDVSSENSKTVIYDYNAISPTNNRLRAFSPIPSTSSDNETFLKNDIRFNESLLQNDIQDEVEVIEIPCETIILDDDPDNDNICTHIIQSGVDVNEFPTPINDTVNDYYDTINVDESFDDDCEIVDVDVVINENNAILENYRKNDINKRNCHISLDASRMNSENETGMTNDFKHKDDASYNNCKNKIADVVKNFFTNQSKNSNSNLLVPTNVDHDSIKRYDCLMEYTQSLITGFTRQDPHTQVPQARNTAETNTCDNIDVMVTLDESTNQNDNICDDSIILISSTAPHWRMQPMAVETNRNINTFSRNRLTSQNNVHQANRLINNDKHRIPKTKAVTNKYNTAAANKNNSIPTTGKVRNIGDCPICLDNLLNVAVVASTNCGHIFCMRCIQTALRTSGKKCPTCRKFLKGTGYHQLFL